MCEKSVLSNRLNDTISVIIPVYNVEAWLDRCIASIVSQSYPELEILLIDDGSTDNSGKLCDVWAEKDSRIRVIHKENGGISDARNTGLDNAAGNYITFVDSDDYTAPNMMLKLHHALILTSADISICNFQCVDEAGIPIQKMNRTLPIQDGIISGIDALWQLELGGAEVPMVVLWNKLFRRELFSTVRFPVGKYCEDALITQKLYMQCDHVACISDVGYYYTQRKDSITRRGELAVDLHYAEASLERMHYFKEKGLYYCAGKACWRAAFSLVNTLKNGIPTLCEKKEQEDVLRELRAHRSLRKYCTAKEIIQFSIICLNPKLYHFLFHNAAYRKLKMFFEELAN